MISFTIIIKKAILLGMHRAASSILLLNCRRNYLKAMKKTFVRHAQANLIYITAVWYLIFHYKQKSNKRKYIIILRIPKLLLYIKIFFSSDHIIIVKLNEYKLKKTAKNKGIIGYQNKPKKELLQIIYKLKHITENLSGNGLN